MFQHYGVVITLLIGVLGLAILLKYLVNQRKQHKHAIATAEFAEQHFNSIRLVTVEEPPIVACDPLPIAKGPEVEGTTLRREDLKPGLEFAYWSGRQQEWKWATFLYWNDHRKREMILYAQGSSRSTEIVRRYTLSQKFLLA